MCVQYHGGWSVPWGCSVPWGYHENYGGYLEYRGGVQYRGRYHDARGDIMINVGDTLSTVGCSVPWGDTIL